MLDRILDRFALWQKFVLLGVFGLLLVTPPSYFLVRETNQLIDAALLEQQGVALA